MRLILSLLLIFSAVAEIPCFGQTNFSVAKFLKMEKPPAYQEAVLKLMLAELNDYVMALKLPETLPLAKDSITNYHVTAPFVANQFGALGSLRTTNYSYGFGKGRHLCYITRIIKGTNPYDYDNNKPYAIDPIQVNTNAAYSMATQFLVKAFVDVSRLSTSSIVSIEPWVILHMTTSKYTVQWEREGRPIVKVVVSPPKAELWTLRVEDSTLILRKPLEVTNLDFLLSQTNAPAETNVPAKQ